MELAIMVKDDSDNKRFTLEDLVWLAEISRANLNAL
jgi:hypothetical protein